MKANSGGRSQQWRNRIVGYSDEPPDQLLANPSNWRIHSGSQQAALAGALAEVGLVQNVIVNKTTGHVVDGHLRITLALRQNQPLIPVTWVELSEDEEKYILATIDPLAAMATADAAALDALLSSVNSGEAAVQAMLAGLAKEAGLYGEPVGDDPGPQVDKAEELQAKWQTATGQLWQLGEHRLICGDCTDPATVRRVMGGEQAVLLFTSPPYAQQRDYKKRIDNWDRLMQGCFQSVQMEENGQVLVNLGIVHVDGEWVPYWDNWIEWMRSVGWKRFGFYVWDKTFALPGDWNGRLAPAHEFIFHFCKQKKRPRKVVRSKWAGKVIHEGDATGLRAADGSMSGWTHAGKATQKWRIPESVARVEPPEFWHGAEAETEVEWFDIPQSVARVSPAMGGVDGHPAPFSVALASWAVDPWSEIGEIVYEPFSGSGTTLIACERLGRRARCVEIEPGYVAVALERWAVMTGKMPELLL